MFDKLLDELKRLEGGVHISVDAPLDEENYYDRICPSNECHSEFKVLFEDWKSKVADERAYCPVCRHEAPSTEWDTDAQTSYYSQKAHEYVQDLIGDALEVDTRQFNSRQRSGFITLSMSYERGMQPVVVTPDAAKVMRQKFTCDACSCRYAAVGAAFFCPACGHNSVIATFAMTIENVRQVVSVIPSIQAALSSQNSDDIAENSSRLILESSLEKLVGTFQHFAEALFKGLPNTGSIKVRKNLFQNLSESSQVWRDATGKGYEDLVSADELGELNCLFQKRHLIAHRNGIVDQEYIDKSGDKTYASGQRLVIQESNVLRMADLVGRLGDQLQKLK